MTDRATIDLPIGVQTATDTVTLESGLPVQLCRTCVRRNTERSVSVSLLIHLEGLALPTERDLANLRATSPSLGILAGFHLVDRGKARLITLPEFEGAGEDIALAAAVCAASWGWDESERIRVTVNARRWDVFPAFLNGTWTATVE